jgi:hypothetical protein
MYAWAETDNNHIKVIEGLNSNIKLNVLSLGSPVSSQPTTRSRKSRTSAT